MFTCIHDFPYMLVKLISCHKAWSKDDNVCVTSLESMIDFVQSTLGKSNHHGDRFIRAFSTTLEACSTSETALESKGY